MAGESVDEVLEEKASSMHRAPLEQGWQKHAKPKARKEKNTRRVSITINIPALFALFFVVCSNRDCASSFMIWLGSDPKPSMANL